MELSIIKVSRESLRVSDSKSRRYTTLPVKPETKQKLDSSRGGMSWNQYLEYLHTFPEVLDK